MRKLLDAGGDANGGAVPAPVKPTIDTSNVITVIKHLLDAEAQALPVISQLYPDSQVVQLAVQLLPIAQKIEQAAETANVSDVVVVIKGILKSGDQAIPVITSLFPDSPLAKLAVQIFPIVQRIEAILGV